MDTILVELKPDRRLFNSKFDGYKLSLEKIQFLKNLFSPPVHRVLLKHGEAFYGNSKLYGMQNHLVGDKFDENVSAYFVDENWDLCKLSYDPNGNDVISMSKVFRIPNRGKIKHAYNITHRFVTESLAVVSDGCGMLYILNTGDRTNNNIYSILHADFLIGENIGYIISDAVYKHTEGKDDELHLVLFNFQRNKPEENFSNMVHWVTFTKTGDNWTQTALRQLTAKGDIQYIHLEKDCEALYVINESELKFTSNSVVPVVETANDAKETKKYTWSQNLEEVIIRCSLPDNFDSNLLKVTTKQTRIDIKYEDRTLLSGNLCEEVDGELTTWSTKEGAIEIIMVKHVIGLSWRKLITGEERGEYVLDTCMVEEVNRRLQRLTSNPDDNVPLGKTFSTEPVEECDFEDDKNMLIFQRLCGKTNKITHKCHLGASKVILTTDLNPDLPPAFGLKYDVDVCVWQPRIEAGNFTLKHEGTLLAFGYIEASKICRKFVFCSPDLRYSCISESFDHLFIYRQYKSVMASELKNRKTGKRVQSVAQQQVFRTPDQEILGVYATNKLLFILGKTYILALKMESNSH